MNATQFQVAMAELPEPPDDSQPPFWDYWRHDLWQRVIATEDPLLFPSWPCIYHTMLVNHWREYVDQEFDYIARNLDRWDAIIRPGPEHETDLKEGTSYSYNMIHQAYHIARWEKEIGERIEDLNTIIEFGGGYGAMALLVHRLGFKGRYIIYDLPEFSLLQEFYLSQAGVEGVSWNTYPGGIADLMIACYSLSETPIDFRRKWLADHPAHHHLLLYSNRFAEYDNCKFFADVTLPPNSKGTRILCQVDHLPPESWYLFK